MAFWHTVFVEVPIETFNPVKTIDDLLRPRTFLKKVRGTRTEDRGTKNPRSWQSPIKGKG